LRASGRFITIRAMRGSGRSTTMVSNGISSLAFPFLLPAMLLFRQMIRKGRLGQSARKIGLTQSPACIPRATILLCWR
jgi:hypothetical protein